MKTSAKYNILTALTFVVLAISIYLTVYHFRRIPPPCTVTHGCETVLTSKYAVILGVPLPILGLLLSAVALLLIHLARKNKNYANLLTIWLGLCGIGALAFLYLQFFVLRKVCQYCFTIDITAIIMFLFDLNIVSHRAAGNLPKLK